MEKTGKLNLDFSTLAWGAFFIVWGLTAMFPTLPEGTGAVGIGIILAGLNLARFWKGQPISGFTTILAILALLIGALQIARPFFHFSFDLPIFAILLLTLGVTLLGRALRGNNTHG